MNDMNFGGALKALKRGERVARRGWNGRGMWLALLDPSEVSGTVRPFVVMCDPHGMLVPWVPSQTCFLAEDWHVVPSALPAAAVLRLIEGAAA